MLKIGVTGNIGSGKTTVCRIFELLGIPVYYADERSKYLLDHNTLVIQQVKTLIGPNAYNEGKADRKVIGNEVFRDHNKLLKLEGILHPAVRDDFINWAKTKDSPYVIKEAALLFESKSYEDLDKTIVVYASREMGIQRAVNRDNASEDDVLARLERQIPIEDKIKMGDYVVKNDGENLILPQIVGLHESLMQTAMKF